MKRLARTLILLTLLLFPAIAPKYSAEPVKNAIYKAYTAVVEAYSAGGDVEELIENLNRLINSTQIDESEIYEISARLIEEAQKAKIEGEEKRRIELYYTIAWIVAAAGAVLVAYFYGGRLYWKIWLRLRGKYKVIVRRVPAERKSMLLSDEVKAVALAVVVVVLVFAISQAYLAGRVVEPFSELGLLGSKMKIGDYPTELVVGEKARLYVYVGNHMGYPMYYIVQVKIGNSTTPIDPAPLEPVKTFERVLPHNATWIFPLEISFNETGLNYRIIVELWIYNYSSGRVEYHKRWCQLWVNVTSLLPPG